MTRMIDLIAFAGRQLGPSVPNARREGELLMECVTGLSRSALYASPDFEPDAVRERRFQDLVMRRMHAEPLQYLTGSASFRRLELLVGPGVLVPRPETEVVTGRALALIEPVATPAVLDIGTGCGAIALSIATERREASVWATEISAEALEWAQANLRALKKDRVELLHGDLFAPLAAGLKESFDLIVSNPPYLSERQLLECPDEVKHHEPRLATVAGPTGLEVTGRLIAQAPSWLKPGGWLVLETWEGQAQALRSLLSRSFTDQVLTRDLTGKVRVIEAQKK